MVRIIKKRVLFFMGVTLTSILGFFGNFIHTNYSESGSLLINTAHADVPSGGVNTGGGDGCSGDGDGCGGCSDGCY